MDFKIEFPKEEKDQLKLSNLFLDKQKDYIYKTENPVYMCFDKIRTLNLDKDISNKRFWFMIKQVRDIKKIYTPVKDEDGKYYSWINLPRFQEFLYKIDNDHKNNFFEFKDIDPRIRQKLLIRGIMEESIASSQLEGASTTRKVAKELLRSGRKPRNESEKMILNSYRAMREIEEIYYESNLDIDMIFQLHSVITNELLPATEQGVLRSNKDKVVVATKDGTIFYQCPRIEFVEKELSSFIDFANGKNDEYFIHPIIKAIILHFWLANLHPFTDGNGRLARIVFYWYMVKRGYDFFMYLPVSKMIKSSPFDYSMAYTYARQDDCDLTYFIDYNLSKIELALKNFKKYLQKKSEENVPIKVSSQQKYQFNDRQIQLLQYFFEKGEKSLTTLKTHMSIYQVTKMTATKDLHSLKEEGFLISVKQGRTITYYGTAKIKDIFKN